jgi:hypothetical protein
VFARVGNPEEGGSHSYTLVGDLGQFSLGRPEALVFFLKILWSFKTLASLWEPQIWQTLAVINSWADGFGIIHQGRVCRAVKGLRSRFLRERQLIGKCKNVETSLFSKWANWGNLWRKLEVLRCLPSQNEALVHGVRSQSFQVVGRISCALRNY